MIDKGIFKFYAFGFDYGLIKRNGLEGYKREDALQILDLFFDDLDGLELQVTRIVAEQLKGITEDARKAAEENITTAEGEKIRAEITKIDPALDAELKTKRAYVLTKKRYPLDTLLGAPHELLAKDVFKSLHADCQKDFFLGCRHIALSQATASAFHLMRALEAHVKALYFAFKKTNRLKKPMWGPMVEELQKKREPKPSDVLLDLLDSIRRHFRNPTQHPDKFYNIDEAQDLLNQTITALNQITKEMKEKEGK